MKLQDIFSLPSADDQIHELKKRITAHPDVKELMGDWNPEKHDVMNPYKRKNGRILVEEAIKNSQGVITKPAKYETDPVNRISLPIEQDLTNIHTAFTVGTEPKLECTAMDDKEKTLLEALKSVYKLNKIKYQNKKVVRSWLSETEVAEYWYTVKEDSWWQKVLRNITGKKSENVSRKLKSMIWSPFRGDTLYPLFDDMGDLIAFSRSYTISRVGGLKEELFMTITAEKVYKWRKGTDGYKLEDGYPFKHMFDKLPVIYSYRQEPIWKNVKPLRDRLETLLSNYADCIDYNFFPKLVLEGDIAGLPGKGKNQMVKIKNAPGTKSAVYYLTWTQTPESVKLELDSLIDKIYSMTNTPRISFETMKGMGDQSGIAFRYTFMGAHMAVENHAEDIGDFMQRRCNFLVNAIASIDTSLRSASKTIDIECEIVPYMIDDMAEKIKMAVEAVSGGVASVKQGVMLAGIVDNVDDEVVLIESDNKKKSQESAWPSAV